jgi:hypothetical protein
MGWLAGAFYSKPYILEQQRLHPLAIGGCGATRRPCVGSPAAYLPGEAMDPHRDATLAVFEDVIKSFRFL